MKAENSVSRILQTLTMSLAVDSSSSHSWPLYSFLWPWLWAFRFCLYLCPASSLCFFPISLHWHLLPCLFWYIFNSFIQFDIFSLGPSPKYSNKLIRAERVPHIPQFYAESPISTYAKTNSVFSTKPIFFFYSHSHLFKIPMWTMLESWCISHLFLEFAQHLRQESQSCSWIFLFSISCSQPDAIDQRPPPKTPQSWGFLFPQFSLAQVFSEFFLCSPEEGHLAHPACHHLTSNLCPLHSICHVTLWFISISNAVVKELISSKRTL